MTKIIRFDVFLYFILFYSRYLTMSSTTSQKFRDFTSEPMKDKVVSEIPGLGPKLASNLEQSGITKVIL